MKLTIPPPFAPQASQEASEAPPLFRTWGVWYGLVLAMLAILILAFTVLGHMYS